MQAEGLRVPPVGLLIAAVHAAWGTPSVIVCDRFRLDDLRDSGVQCPIVPRVSRWSESSADIRALRRFAKDGPLSCDPGSMGLLAASLAVTMVQNDDSGNVRLVKKSSNNVARDDVAAALTLAAGRCTFDKPQKRRRYRVSLA